MIEDQSFFDQMKNNLMFKEKIFQENTYENNNVIVKINSFYFDNRYPFKFIV